MNTDEVLYQKKVTFIKKIAREKALDWLEDNKPIVVPHLVVAVRNGLIFAADTSNKWALSVEITAQQIRSHKRCKTYKNGNRDLIDAEVCGIPNDTREYNIFRLGCYFVAEQDANQFTEDVADALKDQGVDWLLDEVNIGAL